MPPPRQRDERSAPAACRPPGTRPARAAPPSAPSDRRPRATTNVAGGGQPPSTPTPPARPVATARPRSAGAAPTLGCTARLGPRPPSRRPTAPGAAGGATARASRAPPPPARGHTPGDSEWETARVTGFAHSIGALPDRPKERTWYTAQTAPTAPPERWRFAARNTRPYAHRARAATTNSTPDKHRLRPTLPAPAPVG